jgi:hypothetical protein
MTASTISRAVIGVSVSRLQLFEEAPRLNQALLLHRFRLRPLIRKTPAPKQIADRGTWVEPQLLAGIEY